jgi:hypothetical protein
MLPPEIHAELTQLLQALQSPDNSIRTQAEDHLTNSWTATRPEVLLMGLAEQIAASADASVRNSLLLFGSPLPNIARTDTPPFVSRYDLLLPSCSAEFPARVARMRRAK